MTLKEFMGMASCETRFDVYDADSELNPLIEQAEYMDIYDKIKLKEARVVYWGFARKNRKIICEVVVRL